MSECPPLYMCAHLCVCAFSYVSVSMGVLLGHLFASVFVGIGVDGWRGNCHMEYSWGWQKAGIIDRKDPGQRL